jgi:hypothetical protein
MAWPKVVPILEADDILRREMERGDRRCLVGWAINTFGGVHDGSSQADPSKEAAKAIAILNNRVRSTTLYDEDAMDFNDNENVPKEDVAGLWNWMVEELGYTVPCER